MLRWGRKAGLMQTPDGSAYFDRLVIDDDLQICLLRWIWIGLGMGQKVPYCRGLDWVSKQLDWIGFLKKCTHAQLWVERPDGEDLHRISFSNLPCQQIKLLLCTENSVTLFAVVLSQ